MNEHTKTTSPLSQPGDTMKSTIAGVTIQLQVTIEGGCTRTVMAGPTVVDALTDQYTDVQTARTQARRLALALKDGANVWQLADERIAAEAHVLATTAQVLDEALQVACAAPRTVVAEAEIAYLRNCKLDDTSDLAARINADLDGRLEQDRAEQAQLAADIAQIMNASHLN